MSSTKTIGIIGGGQLGQMMAISAIYMGHKVITLDPAADCPSSRVSEVIVAPYDDVDALRQLADRCDVLTYEFENVDADGLDAVIKDGQLPQGTEASDIYFVVSSSTTIIPVTIRPTRQSVTQIVERLTRNPLPPLKPYQIG